MGNCAGKDSDKMVIANTEQLAKEEEDKVKAPEVNEDKSNEDEQVDDDDGNGTDEEIELEEADKLAVIGKKVHIKAEIQATNNESKPEEEEEGDNQAIIEEPKLTESEEEEIEQNSAEVIAAAEDKVVEEIKKEPKDEWVEILDPDQVRKEWIEKKKDEESIQATPNAEHED